MGLMSIGSSGHSPLGGVHARLHLLYSLLYTKKGKFSFTYHNTAVFNSIMWTNDIRNLFIFQCIINYHLWYNLYNGECHYALQIKCKFFCIYIMKNKCPSRSLQGTSRFLPETTYETVLSVWTNDRILSQSHSAFFSRAMTISQESILLGSWEFIWKFSEMYELLARNGLHPSSVFSDPQLEIGLP